MSKKSLDPTGSVKKYQFYEIVKIFQKIENIEYKKIFIIVVKSIEITTSFENKI